MISYDPLMIANASEAGAVIRLLIFIVVGFGLYFPPSIIAFRRGHRGREYDYWRRTQDWKDL